MGAREHRNRGSKSGVIFLSLVFLVIAQASGQMPSVVTWSGRLDASQLKPGGQAKLLVSAQIQPGWHLYSLTQASPLIATKITVDRDATFSAGGSPRQPKPITAFDPNFSIDAQTFEGNVTFTVPIKINTDATAGRHRLGVKVLFQVCNDHLCLPPRTESIAVNATIEALAQNAVQGKDENPTSTQASQSSSEVKTGSAASSAGQAAPGSTAAPQAGGPVAAVGPSGPQASQSTAPALPQSAAALKWRSTGLFRYIWFAMGFGLLALLTPCVFPMIPITVSFFTKQEHRSHGAAIKQAIVYCLGIVVTFTGLGLALALVAGPAGINKVAANPWMNLFLTAVFVIFALNLFGMFEIRLPSRLLTKLDKRSSGGTMVATLLMGLTFTLTSFTCTAAFVGTVLVAATQGDWFWSAIGMLAFSTAFASPFFLLALFPQYLRSLPSSGGWLNSVKVVMGLVELAAAFKFLSNADLVWGWKTVSREMVLAGWIALAVMTTIYLLGKFQLPHDSPLKQVGVVRLLASTLFLGIAFYLLAGLFGTPMGGLDAFLPPATASTANGVATSAGTGNSSQGAWLNSYQQALEQARKTNKPVFINFTGVTCTNCRWMESNMFTDQEIKNRLNSFILAELYTDRQTPEDAQNSELQEKQFSTVALPLYVIVDPSGKTLAQFAGLTRDKAEFVSFLQSGASRFEAAVAHQ